jgi:hypothetical protein
LKTTWIQRFQGLSSLRECFSEEVLVQKTLLEQLENRQAVKEICQQILVAVTPNEVPISQAFIDPLLEMAANDEIVTIDASDQAGGLGGVDLMIAVVVPITVAVLANILTELGKATIEEVKELWKKQEIGKEKLSLLVDDKTIKIIVDRTGSPKARQKLAVLTRAVNEAVAEYFENA